MDRRSVNDLEAWSPVVYGRTRRADRWWRVLPEHADLPWLRTSVGRAVNGGRRLGDGPRFVLSQDGNQRLVGVVCRAIDLSESMNSDGQRDLYCLVGWVGPCRAEQEARGPSLEAFEHSWVAWAGPVYAHWMARDWDQHESRLIGPSRPEAAEPPWSIDDTASTGSPHWSFDGTSAYAWPLDQRAIPWELGRTDTRPLTVLTGLGSLSDIDVEPSDLLAVNDVPAPTQLWTEGQPAAQMGRSGQAQPTPASPALPARYPRNSVRQRNQETRAAGPDVWDLARRQPPPHSDAPTSDASVASAPPAARFRRSMQRLGRIIAPRPEDLPPVRDEAMRENPTSEREGPDRTSGSTREGDDGSG